MSFITPIVSVILSIAGVIGLYEYLPLHYLDFLTPQRIGSTITTINGTDTLSSSRSVINTNFSNLNTDKLQSGSTATTLTVGTLTLTNPLTVAGGGTGAATLTGCLTGNGTGAITGSGTCNTSNATVSSIATTYPILGGTITTTGTLSLAFGTTTSNTWANTQTFSNPIINGTLSGLIAANSGTTYAAATSSIGISAGLTNTGTFGSQVGGSTLNLKQIENRGFSYATTTAWTGTTTIPLEIGYAEVWNTIKCFTDLGTLNVQFGYGTASTTLFNASTTVGTVAATPNNTMTAGSKVRVDIGTPASAPTTLTCTVNDTI